MNFENHRGGMVASGGFWVSMEVVEEMMELFDGFDGWVSLLGGNGRKSNEYRRVDGASVIHEGANDLLGKRFEVWWCSWGEVDGRGTLYA